MKKTIAISLSLIGSFIVATALYFNYLLTKLLDDDIFDISFDEEEDI